MSEGPILPSVRLLVEIFDQFGGRPSSCVDGFLRWPLARCSGFAWIVPDHVQRSQRFRIQVIDLAVRGIGFCTSEPLERGTRLRIQLALRGIRTGSWPCRVVNVLSVEAAQYRVGAVFETWPNQGVRQPNLGSDISGV